MSSYVAPDLTEVGLEQLTSLAGRGALVTGGARGIGEAVARRLAEAGARVVIADRDGDGAESAALRIAERTGSPVTGLAMDIADEASVRAGIAAATRQGPLDLLVNNAAVLTPTGDPLSASQEHLRRMFDVNVVGTFLVTREVAAQMAPGASIVNVISTSGLRVSRGTMAYAASKHALTGLTKSLALELSGRGVRVTGVAPGIVTTPGVAEIATDLAAAGYAGGRPPLMPFGRHGVPDDVARVVLFLCTGLASWVSGSVIGVESGRLEVLA
ncbi:SDR family NAD(P)-dependent oxidoreductase [Aeromicrobium endophyticum]|uniref:SDR family NAD(P)-dependent oxidoreductase n=1 Tax=Aeromicrobium endophyticum TaxID=2292704 RepID=A0A371PDQ9_9ACTN|nr:SDR family oxidoreductase [Aeromicrobium endophyticum]REK74072.1 SDR family NAD(P)-dependent oxidoreductase [Aeromicrobium endophyticum]